jgi:hypothetical protein
VDGWRFFTEYATSTLLLERRLADVTLLQRKVWGVLYGGVV